MSEKLKPCPFCGHDVDIFEADNGYLAWFTCLDASPCKGSKLAVTFLVSDRDKAIAAWNTRAPQTQEQEPAK